jgi:hypothetical protein
MKSFLQHTFPNLRWLRVPSLVALGAALAACAGPNGGGFGLGNTSSGGGSSGNSIAQQCIVETLAAGVTCGLLSKDKNRAANAMVCGVAAYVGCQFYKSYVANQTQSQAEVEQAYKKNNKTLPKEPMVTAFNTTISPNAQVRKKEDLGVSSDLTVVPGRNGGALKIEHEIAVLDKYGVEWFKGKQQPNTSGEAGSYQTAFSVEVPKEMEVGTYSLVQNVYLNGKQAPSKLIKPQTFKVLAAVDGTKVLAFAD